METNVDNIVETDIKQLQVAKVKCLKELLFHTRYFFKKQFNRKFVVNDHHKIVCEALEAVLRGECKRLIINIAPRYSKTELAVKNFISHGLAINPAAKFIHLSYGDDIALDNSNAIKDLIRNQCYQELFPDVKLKANAKAADRWYTTENGGVLARAAGGQVTGFGAGLMEDPDKDIMEWVDDIERMANEAQETELEKKFKFNGAIIIDDPIKPEDADMDVQREKVNSRFDSTIRNRVNSPTNTPIIIIMQRLHPNDLAGYLQRADEADKWTVISLPCIKEDGTALWLFKHTIEQLKGLKKANELVFERQYMQNPQPKTGLMFPLQELNFYKRNELEKIIEDTEHVACFFDPANLGGDDFAGFTTRLIGDRIYITKVLYNTDGEDVNKPKVVQMVLDDGAHHTAVEGVFGWKETARRIREELDDNNYEGDFRVLKPRTAKHVRISSRSSFIKNYFWFIEYYVDDPQYDKFMRNLTSYKKIQEAGKLNKHDEAPDICEMGAGYYERTFPELWTILKTNQNEKTNNTR